MNFCTYVMYSSSFDKLYIGYTSNLISRFYSHNKLATKGFTVRYRPWKVILVEFYASKADALKREKELKSGQGRKWIREQVLSNYL